MKTGWTSAVAAAVAAAIALSSIGCGRSATSVDVALTDAPLGGNEVESVNVAITGVAFHSNKSAADSDGGWKEIELAAPAAVDLLELQNGLTQALGGIELEGGTSIQQIRLQVSSVRIVETGSSTPIEALFSGDDLKINAKNFAVPLSGACEIVVDFDVRKSLVKTGAGSYRLKPVLRAVFSDEAGSISGVVSGSAPGTTCAVFAYGAGAGGYALETDPPAAGSSPAPAYNHAYSSALVGSDGSYKLAYLDAGVYNLWIADASDASGTPLKIVRGVSVESGKNASSPVNMQ